jgi:hypothetical protein
MAEPSSRELDVSDFEEIDAPAPPLDATLAGGRAAPHRDDEVLVVDDLAEEVVETEEEVPAHPRLVDDEEHTETSQTVRPFTRQ